MTSKVDHLIRMVARLPHRVKWTIEVLAVQPHERILEVGCGRGLAVAAICRFLESGHIVGLDRSAKGIAEAEATNRLHVEVGKARYVHAGLAEATLDERFDKVFAVNVNVFWLNPTHELMVVRRLLGSGGRLYLFYEPPSPAQLERIVSACTAFLEQQRFQVNEVLGSRFPSGAGVCIVAAPQAA